MAQSGLKPIRLRFRWARIDQDLPPGIHQPKHPGEDVGWDLESMKTMTIPPHGVVDIPVNCRIELPPGFWAEIKPRSSIAKRGIQLDGGILDNGYRGPIFVICRNAKLPNGVPAPLIAGHGSDLITINAGERIAQLIFHRLNEVWDEEVAEIDITNSARGEAAFGSTGRMGG